MPIEEQYAGQWHRMAGHPDNHVLIHPSAASPIVLREQLSLLPKVGMMPAIIISIL